MIQAIALRFGYVESLSLSWLVFQRDEFPSVPETKKEAFQSLAQFLYLKFKEQIPKPKSCCKVVISVESNYCSHCGCSLHQYLGFDYSKWLVFLDEIRVGTSNDFGYSDYEDDFENNPWAWEASLFDFGIPPDDNMIVVSENAEIMLSCAIAEIYPDFRNLIHQKLSEYCLESYENLLKE